MSYLARCTAVLDGLAATDRLRSIPAPADRALLDLRSNDFLALSGDPRVTAALHAAARAGSGGSRLLAGAHAEHAALEADLAAWCGRQRALLFSSGYLAALGAVGALAPLVEHAFSDALNHACLIDGLRLARLSRTIYPHRAFPPPGARRGRALVVSETIFGMDADAADPAALLAALGPDDILLLDEAHALGIAGPRGAGLAAGIADARIVVIGTLSKALGAHGGFVAGPAPFIAYLQNSARTFIFDTALPPAIASAARAGLAIARAADAERAHLAACVARLRGGLRAQGFDVRGDAGAAVPVVIGSDRAACDVQAALRARGIVAAAIRPPTVPPGTARLRLALDAARSFEDVDRVIAAFAELRVPLAR